MAPGIGIRRFSRGFDIRLALAVLALLLAGGMARASGHAIVPFVGSYVGEASVMQADGTMQHRNMSVTIGQTKKGFVVKWTSVIHKPDGRVKERTYEIGFVPSEREDVYAAAMRRNVFGHEVPLDPMKGEPYVWARIRGKTLSVFSLFVDDEGGYEIQQFDRTLAEGGLMLEFNNIRNGEKQRSITTFLTRQ